MVVTAELLPAAGRAHSFRTAPLPAKHTESKGLREVFAEDDEDFSTGKPLPAAEAPWRNDNGGATTQPLTQSQTQQPLTAGGNDHNL